MRIDYITRSSKKWDLFDISLRVNTSQEYEKFMAQLYGAR